MTTTTEHQGVAMPSRLGQVDNSGIPFTRLVGLELRKLTDTRAGRVLLLVCVGLVVAVSLIGMFSGNAHEDKNFKEFIQFGVMPLQIMLPLLGVLAVTAEWSQRTGLVTFTLEPRRSRVALSKWVAALVLGIAGIVIILAAAVAFTELTDVIRGSNPSWNVSWQLLLGTLVGQLLSMSMGVGFGMLIQNTPGAIVAYLVVPTLWSILGSFSWAASVADWADTDKTMGPLYDATMHGDDWVKLLVSLVIWIGVPMAVGIWRVVHSEVKSA